MWKINSIVYGAGIQTHNLSSWVSSHIHWSRAMAENLPSEKFVHFCDF